MMRLEHRIPSVQPATNVASSPIAGQRKAGVALGPLSQLALLTLLIFCTGVSCGIAQDPPGPNEQFIPADQLDTVFDRDRRGVMMKRAEFRALLEQARAHAAHENIPIPIITQQANITVTPGDQQAIVQMELKIRQYAKGWQLLHLRAGNLLIEKLEIDGQPAVIGRDPADPTALFLAHDKVGEFTAVVSMSTQLATLGGDRTAAFQLPVVPAVELTVTCPAGRHLLVNELQLDRPAGDDAVAHYVVPVGNAPDVRLRWVVQRKDMEAQTLVFVHTDGHLQVQKETLRWDSESRVSVFGGTINKVVAQVPRRLEVTSVESAGLESWTLDDDPINVGFTRVTMTYRQPFTNDRLIKIKAVSAVGEGVMQEIPTLGFSEVTAHTGRLVVTHEDGLRLVSETGGGVRRVSAAELGLALDASVFDFWLQEFELQVTAKPRDRELFVESSGVLAIDDTTATFSATLVVETLNAPLFDLLVSVPAEWQLTSVETSEISNPKSPIALPWTSTNEPNQILVRPLQPIAPGALMTLLLTLTRTIADPDNAQTLALPVVTAKETTIVGGSYVVRFADDLTVAALALTGLTPIAGSGTEQVFQNLGTAVSGELSIVRKPSRLASRSVLKTWADSRQQSLDAEIITDVLSGTIRTLTIRLSESLGPDVRFTVQSVGPVPGILQTRAIRPVTIIEQSAGIPADGLRPFTLKLDQRFAGSLALHAFVQQPRTDAAPISAPVVQVQDAVRQHGVLVFEASPEQQLAVGPEVSAIPGLFVADAGLVDPPAVSNGRRIALIYRFVQPGYTFPVHETRFVTNAVPSAVCQQLVNVCTLNDSGRIQRWCEAKIRSSGVQTIRFTLPDLAASFLWSTMLNGEPVEVRRDGGDYLVAVPTNSESQEQVLTVLFESDSRKNGTFGQTDQGPVQFSIDAGKLQAIPIDVLQQTWRVHYPQSSLLVDSDGQFRPTNGVDQPGWLVSLGEITWPETPTLLARLIPLAIFLLILSVVTTMLSRRRWKSLAVICILGVSLGIVVAPYLMLKAGGPTRNLVEDRLAADSPGMFAPAPARQIELNLFSEASPAPDAPDAAGGMGGFGGRGLNGSLGRADAKSEQALSGETFGVVDGLAAASTPVAGTNRFNIRADSAPTEPTNAPSTVTLQDSSSVINGGVEELRAQLAKPQKGNARLSVNVSLEVPADYQAREFVSVADSVHRPSMLSLVVQRRGQIAAIRLVAALVVILLVWRMSSASLFGKLTLSLCIFLVAVGFSPLLSNAWQSVVDGVALGALVSVAMAFATSCCKSCNCLLTPFKSLLASRFKTATPSSVLLFALTMTSHIAQASGQESTATKETVLQPDIVVPYSPDEPALRAERVFIRHDDFLKLYQQANPDALKSPTVSPLGSTVISAFYKAGKLTQVDGAKYVLSLDARLVVWSDSEFSVNVPLPIGSVAIRAITVDGNAGSVQPLWVGIQAGEIQNFAAQPIPQQQQIENFNTASPALEGSAYAAQITGKGAHVVDLAFDVPALLEGELGRADLPLRNAAAGTLEWILPADGLDAKVNGRTNVYRREGRTILLPIAQLSTVRLQWLPTLQTVAGDVVFHAAVSSAMSVQDSGIVLRTTVAVNCRQGEISELDITIPDGYSVKSVTGEDVAGWTAQSTDATRFVKLLLRRAVNDATSVTLQLYTPVPTTEALASLPVPISMVKGASRDLGTVILKTGSQFQVRSNSLSAVTQINPNEAPSPQGDELAGRPMLAWRYTRHPASVTVKVIPTADELKVEAMHAVRLEEQRQLWSSRLTLQVTGAPRSRIDIAVPNGFLALDVTATGLKDWYLSDALDGDNSDADIRTLSIQLMDALSGQMQVTIQGQMNRDADRTLLRLQPPAVINATKADSELAVWLDAASESAGLENGSDWTAKSTADVNPTFREIAPSAPGLAFTSNIVRPRSLSVKLRQAISTLIGESVTVTNVTETAVEITLALNWQIARAAADQFAVELPTRVASSMTFDIPGQRQVTREDLGNGRTRVSMQLQQPVTDRLFVLGTASLPLPTDRVIRSEMTSIVVPSGAPSTLSGQAHFWVLVNQSNGLLQQSSAQPEDKVSPEQITTQIPPQLLQQAVAVLKLRPETAAWNLVYPEQFQVAPAVVTLATHTTVMADDGSWRSRHQLQVTNESRQFLPVILPQGSRLLYCLVQGRPSRVVIRGAGDTARHLIPIPQAGALASGFEIDFALAGSFEDPVASLRNAWKSSRLMIPVPTFPEFRDDPEFGISVSRNRWTVYVPESWQATLADDPEVTNVVVAAATELQDAYLLSDVEQAATLLKNVKSTKGNYARSKALLELQSATDKLQRNFSNDSGVERQRGEVLSRLSVINNELTANQAPQELAGQAINGNGYLYEQDLGQNRDNYNNSLLFFDNNGRFPAGSGGGQQGLSDADFRFGITLPDLKRVDDTKSQDEAGKKSGTEKSEGERLDVEKPQASGQTRGPESKVDMLEESLTGKDGVAMEGKSSRSQLMQRRAGKMDLGRQLGPQDKSMSSQRDGEFEQLQQAIPQQMGEGLGLNFRQTVTTDVRETTPTGLLSLKFDIPTDGQQIDFLRVGGNPSLSLDVRSSASVTQGIGLIWLAFCVIGILLLSGPHRNRQPLVFCQRLCLILAIAGFAGWIMTIGNLHAFGLMMCLAASIGFAITTAMSHLRNHSPRKT